MRKLLIILIFISLSSYGQNFHGGTYTTSKKDIGFESDVFQIREDGTFGYVFRTCTGIGLGRGKYEIVEGDSLQLNFQDCAECDVFKEIETFKYPSDSIEIDLQIRDWDDGSYIPGVNAIFLRTETGAISDKKGNVKLKIPKFKETKVLLINSIGYNSVKIEVQPELSKVKGVIRFPFYWMYDNTDTKTFKIIKWTKSKLKLERYPDRVITYNLVGHKKIDKMIIEYKIGENDDTSVIKKK